MYMIISKPQLIHFANTPIIKKIPLLQADTISWTEQ